MVGLAKTENGVVEAKRRIAVFAARASESEREQVVVVDLFNLFSLLSSPSLTWHIITP